MKDLTISLNDLKLYSLENITEQNGLSIELPENDYSKRGELWIRYLCSKKGGQLHVLGKSLDQFLDTSCGPVSKFIWSRIETNTPFNGTFKIFNINGVNAVNAVTWLSENEIATLQQNIGDQLKDKTIMHIVDSVVGVLSGAENEEISPYLVGGTMMRGLDAKVQTSVEVVKTGVY